MDEDPGHRWYHNQIPHWNHSCNNHFYHLTSSPPMDGNGAHTWYRNIIPPWNHTCNNHTYHLNPLHVSVTNNVCSVDKKILFLIIISLYLTCISCFRCTQLTRPSLLLSLWTLWRFGWGQRSPMISQHNTTLEPLMEQPQLWFNILSTFLLQIMCALFTKECCFSLYHCI